MVEQNLIFAIGLAALGGLIQVLSVLIIAWPEHLKQTRGKEYKKPMKRILVPINIFVQLFNGAATTGAAIFGPVAIVMPVTVSSQLLFNIIIFGYLQMEEFGKDVQVGTFIVVLGAVVLPIVGPTVQQDQDIMELLSAPLSLVWTSFLFLGVCASGISCFGCVNTTKWRSKSLPVYITLVVARVFSSVLSTSLSKALALVSGLPLITVIVGFLICGFVLGTSVVLQATKTEQKLFVPIISCATQLVNAATGLILWEDWRVVQSWAGYAAMIVQIIVGVYLISSLDFFENTAEPNYGLRQTIALQSASVRTLDGGAAAAGAGGSEHKSKKRLGKVTPDTESADGGVTTDIEIEERRKIWEELKKRIEREEEFVVGEERLPMSSMASVGSVRGLIGGISREPSYQFYRRPTMDILTDAFERKYSTKEKMMIKSLELAEAAARNGQDNFVYEIDSAVMDSIGSLTEYDDMRESGRSRK